MSCGAHFTIVSTVQEPDVSRPSLGLSETPFGPYGAPGLMNVPAICGNPGSTREADKNGETAKEEEVNFNITFGSRFVSLANDSCLVVGPPYSRSLMLLSGSMPIALRNDFMLCWVPLDFRTSVRFIKTLRRICVWTNFSGKVLTLMSASMFSALMYCSRVESLNSGGR